MKAADSCATWEILNDFGFQPGLKFDFGDLTLAASAVTTGWRLTPVVLFTGIFHGRNSFAEVHFEMPRTVDSPAMCAAWIAWHLDQLCDGGYHSLRAEEWLALGRANKLLLPWVIDMEAYERRPQCYVEKEWARMMLKRLQYLQADVKDSEPVSFEFDGKLLLIRCDNHLIPGEAKGAAWAARYFLKACQLKEMPRRLGRYEVEFSVWNGKLKIDNRLYEGVVEGVIG